MIAGCAPCQPFSSMSNADTKKDSKWALLKNFADLVEEVKPDYVTMENVPELENHEVFDEFVERLNSEGYNVDHERVYAPEYDIPQTRRRLILVAAKDEEVEVPNSIHQEEEDFQQYVKE